MTDRDDELRDQLGWIMELLDRAGESLYRQIEQMAEARDIDPVKVTEMMTALLLRMLEADRAGRRLWLFPPPDDGQVVRSYDDIFAVVRDQIRVLDPDTAAFADQLPRA